MVSLFLVLLLIFSAPILMIYGLTKMDVFNVYNPGFEGVKCNVHGINFAWGNMWDGVNILHRYQDHENILMFAEGSTDRGWTSTATSTISTIKWGTAATPNYVTVTGRTEIPGYSVRSVPDLFVHVENNPQLQDVNRQGDPLGWDLGTDLRVVNYWLPDLMEATVVSETDTTITYDVSATRETVLLVPVDFWLGVGVDASTENALRSSDWREGQWKDMAVWFRLDFNTWDLAYGNDWKNDDGGQTFDAQVNQYAANYQLSSDYRGGFPIAGWIQGWEKAGWTSYESNAESPTWFKSKGKDERTLTLEQSAILGIKDDLQSRVNIAPSTVGTTLSLYTEPSSQFIYSTELETAVGEDPAILEQMIDGVKTPSSAMQKTMYFPVNILDVGTKVTGDWWNGWTVYYPTVYLHVRVIYGVYGHFTYLWTQEVTKDVSEGGFDFPEEFERKDTTVVYTPGAGESFSFLGDIGAFLTSPLGILVVLLSLFMIILVILAVTGALPGLFALLTVLAGRKRKGGG